MNDLCPKVTVIIPSYNSKTYLEECLESIINQTLKELEIIFVDAGSTDGTLNIVKKYAEQDNRIHIFLSERKSYGYQVNRGIEAAKGDTIAIVDSDDYIESDALEEMYNIVIKHNIDFVKTNFTSFIDIDDERYFFSTTYLTGGEKYYGKIFNPNEMYLPYEKNEYIWNGLYKTEFLKKNKIRLNESQGAAFQDKGMYVKTLYYAKRMEVINRSFYFYRRANLNSSVYNESAINNVIGEYEYIFDFLRGKKEAVKIRTIYFWKFIGYVYDAMQIFYRPYYIKAMDKNYEKIVKLIKQTKDDGILNSSLNSLNYDKYQMLVGTKDAFIEQIKRNAKSYLFCYRRWIDEMAKKPNIIICCTNDVGRRLFVFLKINGIEVDELWAYDDSMNGKKCGNHKLYDLNNKKMDKNNYYIIAGSEKRCFAEEHMLKAGVSVCNFETFTLPLNLVISICNIRDRVYDVNM